MSLKTKIASREAVIGIIGPGCRAAAGGGLRRGGIRVIGIDVDGRKVEALNRQESYIEDIAFETLAAL